MFKKVASDVLGLSDIGQVISPKDYDKVASDDYVLHEDGEKIYFLIKSQSDEYCFTNYALIHLDGTSATSKKRLLKRYSYKNNHFSEIKLETAGTVDLDIEIKFNLGSNSYSIDVRKQDIEYLKDLYKSLIKISSIQKENALYLELAEKSLNIASNVLKPYHQESTEQQFKAINSYTFNWLKKTHQAFNKKDFSNVFLMFINN
ncbi:PH domain-containing protein [Cyanobacterium aponinum FACHB-4101]|uniref:PH domain-containing protein n=1 Tax=Cyanobacterium aponinum TaxID=379064 RepID=UPI00168076E6|nr:PH domain-containing protein [Cyanobacterium aponinum]MBD2394903.1 PH domain-containing protein [Cyanobacterium aponinum FACHB-4101]